MSAQINFIANEAELSSGVAVLHFRSKNDLLTAALKDMQQKSGICWRNSLTNRAPDPASTWLAALKADFESEIRTPEFFPFWCAFWSEQSFPPQQAKAT